MNLLEVIIGFVIIVIVVISSYTVLNLKNIDQRSFFSNFENKIKYISLYNYSYYLLDNCEMCTLFINLEKNNIFTGSKGYYLECNTGYVSKVGYLDTGVNYKYCKIFFDKNKIIYNYKISN